MSSLYELNSNLRPRQDVAFGNIYLPNLPSVSLGTDANGKIIDASGSVTDPSFNSVTVQATGGYKYVGTLTASGAGATQTLNAKAGQVTFTGINFGNNSTVVFTITNNKAGSLGLVTMELPNTSTSTMFMESAVFNSGSNIVVSIFEQAGVLNNVTVVLKFICFN